MLCPLDRSTAKVTVTRTTCTIERENRAFLSVATGGQWHLIPPLTSIRREPEEHRDG